MTNQRSGPLKPEWRLKMFCCPCWLYTQKEELTSCYTSKCSAWYKLEAVLGKRPGSYLASVLEFDLQFVFPM